VRALQFTRNMLQKNELLHRSDNDFAIWLFTLRKRNDTWVIYQGKMNKTTFVCIHGSQDHTTALAFGALRSSVRNGLKLGLATALVALDIDNNRIVELCTTAHQRGENHLKRIKGPPMPPDKNSKISTVYVKDEFALITIVFVDRAVRLAKESKDALEERDCLVGNLVRFLIR